VAEALWTYHDYTTIAPGALSDRLARVGSQGLERGPRRSVLQAGEALHRERAGQGTAAGQPAAQHRLRLGVLDNSKGNADHLLRFIVEGVKAALPVASVVMTRKGSVSLPAPADVLDRLTREADFVVSAMAD
jgi:hypothetical protein